MRNTGTTLLELVLALAVLSAMTAVAAPRLADLRDRAEVRAAREQLVGLVTRTRTTALNTGGARMDIEAAPPRVRVLVDDSVLWIETLGPEGRAPEVRLPAGRVRVELAFDALGIGRFAGTTVLLRRRTAEAGVVISSYGRVRRR